MSSASRVNITTCKGAPLPVRKPAASRRVAAAACDGDKPEFWESVRSAVPMVCLSAAMALSAGAAGASTLSPAYGGSVGGSDNMREAAQAGAGKVADAGADLLNNLPQPNLPDPATSDATNRPARTVGGALNKTASNIKNTFDIGGENAENVGPGVAAGVKSIGQDLKSKAPPAIQSSIDNQAQNARDTLNRGKQEVGGLTGGNPLEGVQNLFSGNNPAEGAKDAVQGARDALQRSTGLTGNPVEDGKNALRGQNPVNDAVQRNTGSNPLEGVKEFFSGGNAADNAAGILKESASNQMQNARDAANKGKEEAGRVSGFNPLQRSSSFTPGQNPLEEARGALQSSTGLTGNPIEDGKNALRGQNPVNDAIQRNTGSNPLEGVKEFFSGGNPADNAASNAPGILKESASNQMQNARDAVGKGQQEVGRVSGGDPLEGVKDFFSGSNPGDAAKDAAKDAADSARGALQRSTGLTGNPIEDGKNALRGQNPVNDALKGDNPLSGARDALQRNTGLTGNPIEDGKNALRGQNPIEEVKQRNTSSNPLGNLLKGGPVDTAKGGADRLKDNFVGSGVKNEFEAGNQNLQQNANTVKGAPFKGAGNEQKDLQQGLLKGVVFNFESANPLQQTVSQNIFSSEQGPGKAIKEAQEKLTEGGPKTLGQAEEKAIKFGADDAKQGGGFPNPLQGAGNINPSAGGKDAERLLKQGANSVQNAAQSGVNQLQRGVTFDKGQETFKTGGQPLDQGSSERSGNVQSGANMLGNNVYRGVKDAVDDVRERTTAMERGESGIKGVADNVKDNLRQSGEKAQQTGKSIFGQ